MSEFYVDVRDIRFNLFDFLDLGGLSSFPRFEDYDAEIYGDIIQVAVEQARELIAPLNDSGDRIGVRLEEGRVKMPKGWREAYEQYVAAGWNALPIPVEEGGQGLPITLNSVVQDVFTAANVSFLFTPGLTMGALGLLAEYGTEAQKKIYLQKMLEGVWSGTMCLTEPGAGTAVPDLKSTATPIRERDGFYKIQGQKIFISAGDQDLTENIVHMVLAKVDDDADISLFIVPRLRVADDGSLELNDVTTVGIEEKMGIHASPTCSLSFGDDGDCIGWLLGVRGEGLKCMFKMMNEARTAVGLQGVGLANLAYQRAVRYAKERIQGTRVQESRNKDAERVAIVEHPDVRRMLLQMKSIAEGSRALAYYASYCQDRVHAAASEAEAKKWSHQVEILTPIVKAWCSDEAYKAAELGIQVHGGYGYIREYGMEQIARDAKIASLYEGTNGVQALDLLGRKVSRGGGVMMMTMLNEVNGLLNGPAKEGPFAAEIASLGKARDAVASTAMGFGQRTMKGDVLYPVLHATPFLQMFGDLLVGWLLTAHAIKAQELLEARCATLGVEATPEAVAKAAEGDDELRFLFGKVQTARFFVHQVVPRVRARKASVDSEDRSALLAVF